MEGPLEHVSVLDLTRLLPGGFCTLLLADLGADVLKIEEPGKGDYMRWMPPMSGEDSAGHVALNRGKRAMTLNLKHPRGVEVLNRLARDADVLVESFRPGVMDRLGVGFSALQEVNPRLVYCAITGYGQDGPYRDRAGHDMNYLGFGGVLGIIGERGRGPVVPGVQIADVGGGGLMGAVGILAALAERERTGRGKFVDVSMFDGAVSWLSIHAAAYFMTGEIPERGLMRLSGAPACYRVYRCKDGKYVTVGALEPQFWAELCKALGVPEMIERQLAPIEEQDRMSETLEGIFLSRTRDEWVSELADLDACFGPVNDFEEAFRDPQMIARGMVGEIETSGGVVRAIGNPLKITVTPGDTKPAGRLARAPGFGEHTEQALADAGYTAEEIAALQQAGAV